MITHFTESVHDINELSIDIVIRLSLYSVDWIPDPTNHRNAQLVFDWIAVETSYAFA